MRRRNGQVHHDLDVGIGEQRVDRHRLHRMFRRLRLGRFGANVGDRLHPDQPRSRRASQIGVADTAAADDADRRRCHCRSALQLREPGEARARAACRIGRLVVLHDHPAVRRSRDRSATARANPARRRRHRPSRPRPAWCLPVRCPSRGRRSGGRDSGAATPPARRRRAPATPHPPATSAVLPSASANSSSSAVFAPSFGFSSQLWLW